MVDSRVCRRRGDGRGGGRLPTGPGGPVQGEEDSRYRGGPEPSTWSGTRTFWPSWPNIAGRDSWCRVRRRDRGRTGRRVACMPAGNSRPRAATCWWATMSPTAGSSDRTTPKVALLRADGGHLPVPAGSKDQVSDAIWDAVVADLPRCGPATVPATGRSFPDGWPDGGLSRGGPASPAIRRIRESGGLSAWRSGESRRGSAGRNCGGMLIGGLPPHRTSNPRPTGCRPPPRGAAPPPGSRPRPIVTPPSRADGTGAGTGAEASETHLDGDIVTESYCKNSKSEIVLVDSRWVLSRPEHLGQSSPLRIWSAVIHRLFTSEPVTEGHPTRSVTNQRRCPGRHARPGHRSWVAVETMITTGAVHVAGESPPRPSEYPPRSCDAPSSTSATTPSTRASDGASVGSRSPSTPSPRHRHGRQPGLRGPGRGRDGPAGPAGRR